MLAADYDPKRKEGPTNESRPTGWSECCTFCAMTLAALAITRQDYRWQCPMNKCWPVNRGEQVPHSSKVPRTWPAAHCVKFQLWNSWKNVLENKFKYSIKRQSNMVRKSKFDSLVMYLAYSEAPFHVVGVMLECTCSCPD